jgi:hypothetical protein
MSRSADMMAYEQKQVEVSAQIYNLWRRAKLHTNLPLRFPLTGYRGLVMLIDENEWLCADENQYDLPIICWFNFCDKGRDAIHLPVKCTQNLYHYAAHKICDSVLELMQNKLEALLSKHTWK